MKVYALVLPVCLAIAAGAFFIQSDRWSKDVVQVEAQSKGKDSDLDERKRIEAHVQLVLAELEESYAKIDRDLGLFQKAKVHEAKAVIAKINYLEIKGLIDREEAKYRRDEVERSLRIGLPISHGSEKIPKSNENKE